MRTNYSPLGDVCPLSKLENLIIRNVEVISSFHLLEIQLHPVSTICLQAWHAWAVMNFEAVLHYKHQNTGRDEKKKLRHASGASANSEASNSDSEVDSTDHSPMPSPGQKKYNEVRAADDEILFTAMSSPSDPNQAKVENLTLGTHNTHKHFVCITHGMFQPLKQQSSSSVQF